MDFKSTLLALSFILNLRLKQIKLPNYTYMIGLTKRSHVAPKMQHVTFCDSIVRFVLCLTKRVDTVCGVTWIPLCARDGSVIRWGRGKGETLSIHVVSTQCVRGLRREREGITCTINRNRSWQLVYHFAYNSCLWHLLTF